MIDLRKHDNNFANENTEGDIKQITSNIKLTCSCGIRTNMDIALPPELITKIEGMKKRMDVGDIGASSVSLPGGKIWHQETRKGYNLALQDVIDLIKKGQK